MNYIEMTKRLEAAKIKFESPYTPICVDEENCVFEVTLGETFATTDLIIRAEGGGYYLLPEMDYEDFYKDFVDFEEAQKRAPEMGFFLPSIEALVVWMRDIDSSED
jgi:hypothetical protein